MVQLLFFHFRVTNSKLKNTKLHFELPALSRLILKTQFLPLGGHQGKTSLFFRSLTKSNYLYIIISYCSQPLFSKLNLLVTRKPETQTKCSIFVCRKHWLKS